MKLAPRAAALSLLLALPACGGADALTLFADAGSPPMDAATVPDSTSADVAQPRDTGTATDAFVQPDVHVGPGDTKIQCGTVPSCSAQTEICCHHEVTTPEWECVSDISGCSNVGDVPIGCSGSENCVSQGNPTYLCCADVQQNGMCSTAVDVSCQATCDPTLGQVQVGCGGSEPPCPTQAPQCKLSTCTLPGYDICY